MTRHIYLFFQEFCVLVSLSLILTGCTISFQNISTHGMATDLVDETQGASAEPDISLPAF